MTVTDKDIEEVIECFVDVANETGVLVEIAKQYTDQRSLAIRIDGSQVKTGFILKNGQIANLREADKPTVLTTINRNVFWRIINSDNPAVAKALIYSSVFCDESIKMVPPPGVGGGALHLENLILIFEQITKVIGG